MKLASILQALSIAAICSIPEAHAFLSFLDPMPVKPGLSELVDSQKEVMLDINLDIGDDKEDSSPRLSIQGLKLKLSPESADGYEHVKLPGANGPTPKLSSGARQLEILTEGKFIDMSGTRHVKTLKACWELVWRKDALAGALICGFEVPEDYSRNSASASLTSGRTYMSFPVWTQEGLKDGMERKQYILQRAKECIEERDEELTKMNSTNNPLMKALHYRNAYAAMEVYYMQPLSSMEQVPEEGETVKLDGDLFLTTKGLVWRKDQLSGGSQVLLGAANILKDEEAKTLLP